MKAIRISVIAFLVGSLFGYFVVVPLINDSPSSEPVAEVSPMEAPALISTLDLQRELNRLDPKLKLQEDGVYGTATRTAHEQALGNQYAVELWPEDAK